MFEEKGIRVEGNVAHLRILMSIPSLCLKGT